MHHFPLSFTLTTFLSLALFSTGLAGCGAASPDAPPAATATTTPARPTAATTTAARPATTTAPGARPATATLPISTSDPAETRFDMLVRDDFFAGLLRRDTAALDRAMKLCEDTLARDPKHAEALVWHGGGLILHAGTAFRAGDKRTGATLWSRGLAEMDRAVALAPDDVGTLIPRGAVLLAVSPFVPEPDRSSLLAKGLQDYEKVFALQKDVFDDLSGHARSQLLYGLADGWQRRGDMTRARLYYKKLEGAAGDSAYGKRARAWLAGDTAPRPMSCAACHAN